jgi:hypothetical protein
MLGRRDGRGYRVLLDRMGFGLDGFLLRGCLGLQLIINNC